jgi:hypothetical protein
MLISQENKMMWTRRHLVGLILMYGLFCFGGRASAEDVPSPEQVQKMIAERTDELQRFSKDRAATRGADNQFARLSVLTDLAVQQEADQAGIKVTNDEVSTMLLPLLVRQGLIDVSRPSNFRTDENVQHWLTAQGSSIEKLYKVGKTLLLYTKLITKDVSVTRDEVEAYVKSKPEIHIVPVRVQLDLTRFTAPDDLSDKSASDISTKLDTIAPKTSIKARSASNMTVARPKGWDGLHLYVDINATDPVLREALAGHGVGDPFGPLALTTGATISGTIVAVLPEVDLAKAPEYWAYAGLLTKLGKVNQVEQYQLLANGFLTKNPAMRGLLGDVGDWLNNNIIQPAATWVQNNPGKTVGTAAGIVATAFGADPQWIQRGWAIGGTVDGFLHGTPGSTNFPPVVNNYTPTIPTNFDTGRYFGSGAPSLPSFQQWNYTPPSPISFIPPYQPTYFNQWQGAYNNFPQFLSPPVFAPPVMMPMGPRWF